MKKRFDTTRQLFEKNNLLGLLFESQKRDTVIAVDRDYNVLFHVGTDQVLDVNALIKPGKTNLADFQHRVVWSDVLVQVVKSAFANGSYVGELHVGDNWYEVTGKLVSTENKSGILLLLFTDKTESKELLELNQIYKDKHDSLLKRIELANTYSNLVSEKLQAMFNSIPFPAVLHEMGADGSQHEQMVEANPKALSFFNIAPNDITTADLNLDVEDEALRMLPVPQRNLLFDGQQVRRATYIKDGRLLHLELLSQHLRYGAKDYRLTIYVDRSEEISAVVQLNRQLNQAQNILENIGNGVMLLDAGFECKFANTVMLGLLGNEMARNGKSLFDVLNTKTTLFHLGELVGETFRQKNQRSVELQLLREPDRWFNLSLVPVIEGDEADTVVVVLKDITRTKEQEQKFIRNILQAEESNKLKTIFLSNLSHEVRTPMNGILGFLDLLEMDHLSEDQSRFVELIRKSTDQLLTILNSMMEISQLETNQVELDREWVNISSVQEQMMDSAQKALFRSGKNHIGLAFRMEKAGAGKILLDQECVFKAYNQLVENAIKFTVNGTVEIGLVCDESSMRFWIKDTGMGIKQSLKDAIYLPFTSFGNAEGEVYGGIGLGLTIVKGLVALQNGSIDFESEQGKGTTFWVDIPVKMMPIEIQSPVEGEKHLDHDVALPEQMPLKIKKVLLVEDSFENSQLMRALLEQLGVEVLYAYDGITAIETFYESANIELVFCDIRLPDIDGFEVLSAIRRINPQIPVVANTAYVMNEDRKKCLEAGFNEYMAKPIMREDLVKILVNPPRYRI
ncbi:MAG: response regulator [Breznakibacter sp.]